MDGVFAADRECPAPLSMRKGTNPGDAGVRPGETYDIIGLNRRDGTHFRIEIPDAEVDARRWVEIDCGRRVPPKRAEAPPATEPGARANVLAVTWMPAFCEGEPDRRECRLLNGGAKMPAAKSFALHGLWPQPRDNVYCGVDEADQRRRWSELPFPRVTRETAEALIPAMPGVASHLHRHEWTKHGTCYGGDGGADEYFADSLWLLQQLNASDVQVLFEAYMGDRLEPKDVRAAVDASFGDGAGDRVETVCGDGMILELRLNLAGTIVSGETELGDLMLAARSMPEGCGGRVDVPG